MTGSAADPAGDLRWERALDELEASVLEAEALLHARTPTEPMPWVRPVLDGPLPAHLVERARELDARQRALLVALPAAMSQVRQQRDVTGRITGATAAPRRSVYIDQTA